MPSPRPDAITETLALNGTALDWLPAIATLDYPIALLGEGFAGEWDILAAAPQRVLCQQADGLFVLEPGKSAQPAGDTRAFTILDQWLKETSNPLENMPFSGGLAGYWGYECLHVQHGIALAPSSAVPLLWVGDYRWALLHHRPSGRWQLVADSQDRLVSVRQWLLSASPQPSGAFSLSAAFQPTSSRDDYRQAFAKVQAYLQAGDCYQVNLARHYAAPYEGSPASAFVQLAQAHEAPFAAFIGMAAGQAVLSLSPESFLSVGPDGHVSTRPIKGTRPRHGDARADRAAAEELASSEKDRAENLMIVDLLRNDLGKCCEPGSIRVTELFRLESHPNVHHLVSQVEGQCQPGIGALGVLEACFPGGSITGAPKHRAMQVIAELETVSRSVYCGAIGFINGDGSLRSSIAIRTLVADGSTLHCWGGSGIVADSDVDSEYRECEDKVRAFMDKLGAA